MDFVLFGGSSCLQRLREWNSVLVVLPPTFLDVDCDVSEEDCDFFLTLLSTGTWRLPSFGVTYFVGNLL